jgi:hypothetical protein
MTGALIVALTLGLSGLLRQLRFRAKPLRGKLLSLLPHKEAYGSPPSAAICYLHQEAIF